MRWVVVLLLALFMLAIVVLATRSGGLPGRSVSLPSVVQSVGQRALDLPMQVRPLSEGPGWAHVSHGEMHV